MKHTPYIKKVTLKDLAKELGYSINTISRALKDKEDISLATRKTVKKLAAERGYIPDVIAGSLRSNTTKTIAVVIGDISNPFFGIAVKGIETTAHERGYHLIIANSDEIYKNEEDIIRTLLGKRIDGFIISPVQTSHDDIIFLRERGIPYVLLGRHFEDIPSTYLIANDTQGGYLATKYLIDKGHRNILVITGPQCFSCVRGRLQGFIQAMSEADIPVREDMICELNNICGKKGYFVNLLNEHKLTAVFAFSDHLAFQVLYTMEEIGIQCPQDIAVVGFDNVQANLFIPRPLTTVNIPIYAMGKRATEILLKKIETSPHDELDEQIVYDVNLIIRETT